MPVLSRREPRQEDGERTLSIKQRRWSSSERRAERNRPGVPVWQRDGRSYAPSTWSSTGGSSQVDPPEWSPPVTTADVSRETPESQAGWAGRVSTDRLSSQDVYIRGAHLAHPGLTPGGWSRIARKRHDLSASERGSQRTRKVRRSHLGCCRGSDGAAGRRMRWRGGWSRSPLARWCRHPVLTGGRGRWPPAPAAFGGRDG